MTSFHRLSALKAIVIGAALSMTAGFAFAADSNVSADQIVNALRAKSPTRGLSAAPQADPAARAKEISFVGQVRDRKTRSLSLNERDRVFLSRTCPTKLISLALAAGSACGAADRPRVGDLARSALTI